MTTFAMPNPIAQLVAFGLLNENAYSFQTVHELITKNVDSLNQSFIPTKQLNTYSFKEQSFAFQLFSNPKTTKIFGNINSFSKPSSIEVPSWDELTAPNIFSLALMNKDFYNALGDQDKLLIKENAKIRFLIGNLFYEQHLFYKKNKESQQSVIDLFPTNLEAQKKVDESFICFDMTAKDFSILILISKIKSYNYILKEGDLYLLSEDEKLKVKQLDKDKKLNANNLVNLLDNPSQSSYIFKRIGLTYDYDINKENLAYVIHDITSENDLSKILNNLSNNHKLKPFVEKDVTSLETIFPPLWEKFTDTNIEYSSLSFNNDPDKFFTVLYKLGILKEDVLKADRDSGFFLSKFMLNKASEIILNKLLEHGFYTKEWLEQNTNETDWKNIISTNNSSIYSVLQYKLDISAFDIAPKNMHIEILNHMMETCSDFTINHAIQSENFDIKLMDQITKIKGKQVTTLHKLLTKGFQKTLVTALENGANYNIPDGNTILDYMASKTKYAKLLHELNPLLFNKKLQEKIPNKSENNNSKLKI